LATENGAGVHRPRRGRRRPIPLRLKIAIAGLLGLTVAWLIPKGGGAPIDDTTPTPTPPSGLTAAEERLADVPMGVSFRSLDGVRIFLVRTGDVVVGFHGVATTGAGEAIHWCPKNGWFEGDEPGPWYGSSGVVLRYSAPRNLDRISVLVAAKRVTIFPHQVLRGDSAPATPNPPPPLPPPPPPCAENERVG
jgi:hypothetical protein